jgi:hypothetical protein
MCYHAHVNCYVTHFNCYLTRALITFVCTADTSMPAVTDDRPYRHTDDQAISMCDSMLLAYNANMPALAAVDPAFDAAFATAWKNATDAFLEHPTHELVQDYLTGYGQAVDKAMGRGNRAVSNLRYYVQQAFGSAGIYRSFMFGTNNTARHRTAAYAVYLRTLHRMATMHLAALQAQGLTPAHMQELLDAADAILAAELDHEAYKGESIYLTYQRTQLRNTMWAHVQKVNAAADVAFMNDPIKRALFNVG